MKALYLEPDEEITSVIDRLKEIDDADIAIVIPKRAGILQSIVNLKLLRHQAEQLKKRISIVTTDKTGRNLASAVGLTVYQRMPEGAEVKESAVQEAGAPVPIRFKRGSGPEAEPKTEPVVQTREVHEPAPEPEPTPESPKAESPAPEAAAEPASAVAEAASAPKKSRRGFRFPKPRLPRLHRPKLGRIGGIGLVVALLVLLGGGGALAVFVLPKATVDVTPKTDPLSTDVPLTFSARAQTTDQGKHVVAAKVIEVKVDSSVQTASTGSPSGGEKAKGEVTIVNTLSRTQPLVAKTRFQAPNGKIFRTDSSVIVPAGGKQTVTIVADEGGADGNLPTGTRLSIPGLHGSTGVYGQVDTALTGGSNGQGQKQVSDADVERGKSELAQKATRDGVEQARSKLAVGYKLNDQVSSATVLTSNVSPDVGAAADRFTVTGTVTVRYFTYQDSDVQKLLDPALKAKVPAGSDLVDETTRQTFLVGQTSANELSGAMRLAAFTAHKVSRDEVKREIAGLKPGEVTDKLKRSGQANDVKVTLWPFWVTAIPTSLGKIDVRFTAGGVTPAASPSPAPSPGPVASPSVPPSL